MLKFDEVYLYCFGFFYDARHTSETWINPFNEHGTKGRRPKDPRCISDVTVATVLRGQPQSTLLTRGNYLSIESSMSSLSLVLQKVRIPRVPNIRIQPFHHPVVLFSMFSKYFCRASLLRICTAKFPASIMAHPLCILRLEFGGRGSGGLMPSS